MAYANVDKVSDIPHPEKPETWTFQIGCSWLGERDTTLCSGERLAVIKKVSENLAEPFRSAVLWIPEDTTVYTDSMSYWVPVPWDNHMGRVTLCGDAAHPLPPCMFTHLLFYCVYRSLIASRNSSGPRNESLYSGCVKPDGFAPPDEGRSEVSGTGNRIL
jgi:hypothetical protein